MIDRNNNSNKTVKFTLLPIDDVGGEVELPPEKQHAGRKESVILRHGRLSQD